MNVIKSDRVVMVDCDETLILWDISEYPKVDQVNVYCHGKHTPVALHRKNYNLLRKFHRLGYTIIVWSASGWEWAEAVVKGLRIENMVTSVSSKPRYYFDDVPCEKWMGSRIYRDPITGKEST